MAAPPVPVRRIIAPAPDPSPMAYWEVDDASVTLGLPGLGSIRASRDDLAVEAPDDAAADATWTRLGNWATVQFHAAHGLAVFPGCAVGRHDKAVVITGLPRHGATLLGLQLTRHGWGLISDGLAIVDSLGMCRSTGPWATADAQPVDRLFPDYPREAWHSGRDRTRVQPPSHPDAPFALVINVRVKESLESLAVHEYTDEAAGERVRTESVVSLIPGAIAPLEASWRPLVTISRPVPRTHSDMQSSSPVAMAERLLPILNRLL